MATLLAIVASSTGVAMAQSTTSVTPTTTSRTPTVPPTTVYVAPLVIPTQPRRDPKTLLELDNAGVSPLLADVPVTSPEVTAATAELKALQDKLASAVQAQSNAEEQLRDLDRQYISLSEQREIERASALDA